MKLNPLVKQSLLMVSFLLIALKGQAQVGLLGNDSTVTGFDSLMFATNVTHLDEFIDRFNGMSFRADLDEKYRNRKDGILFLFDGKSFKSRQDSSFLAAESFCRKVVEDSIYIDRYEGDWYAEATCQALLNGKEVSFQVFLCVAPRGEFMYKWVICGVAGDIFNTSRHMNLSGLYISPSEHDLRFGELSRITQIKSEFIDEYTKDHYRADPLSIFLTLVRTGQLKIEFVSHFSYKFYNVPGYVFTVNHLSRRELNSGWLITDLESCDEIEKMIKLYKVGKN